MMLQLILIYEIFPPMFEFNQNVTRFSRQSLNSPKMWRDLIWIDSKEKNTKKLVKPSKDQNEIELNNIRREVLSRSRRVRLIYAKTNTSRQILIKF